MANTITARYSDSGELASINLGRNMGKAADSLKSLSSGQANVSAAAKAIGNKLDSISKVLQAARTNAKQGSAVISVAQGALTEVIDLLSQAKALAAQAVSGALDDSARGLLQDEYAAIMDQINKIASQTRWNGASILDGGTRTLTEAGVVAGTTSTLLAAPANTFQIATDTIVGFAEGTASSTAVTGATGAYNVTLKVVNEFGTQTFSVTNFNEGTGTVMTLTNAVTGGTIAITCDGADVSGLATAGGFKTALDTMLGLTSGATPVSLISPSAAFANGMATGSITAGNATAAGTYQISHAAAATTMVLTNGPQSWSATVTDGAQTVTFGNGVTVVLAGAFAVATVNNPVKFTVTTAGKVDLEFQTAETEKDLLTATVDEVTTGKLGIGFTSVSSTANAKIATPLLGTAITTVNSTLAKLQAQQSQLESTSNNLEIAVQNTNAAKATFLDADVAKEMTEYVKYDVLSKSASAAARFSNRQRQDLTRLLEV